MGHAAIGLRAIAMLRAAAAGAALAGLSGCVATMPSTGVGASPASYTTAEKEMRNQAQPFSKTSLQACAAGAAAGAVLGLLVDSLQNDDRKNSRRDKVLIGAAGGCVAGMATNVYVQNKRNQYQDNEARINAMIADVREDNERLSDLVATTRDVIADDKRRIAEVNRQVRNKEISAAQARAELSRVKENRRLLGNTIDGVKQRQADWTEISKIEKQAGANTAGLDAEIARLEKKRVALEAEAALIDREIAATPAAA